MKEHHIEQALKQAVEELGGLCWKFTSPSTIGVPDRICIHAGRVIFVEVKAPGCQPRPSQQLRIKQLRTHGATVHVVDSVEDIEGVCDALRAS